MTHSFNVCANFTPVSNSENHKHLTLSYQKITHSFATAVHYITVHILISAKWMSETGGDYVFTFVCLCALSPIGMNWQNAEKCIRLLREKLWIFPYGQYIIGIYVSLAFWRYSQVQDQSGCFGKMYKNATLISCKMDFLHMPQHAVQRWAPMTSSSLAGIYRTHTLLGRRVCKRVAVYMITLSCTWRIYALSERLLVFAWNYHTFHWMLGYMYFQKQMLYKQRQNKRT